MKTKLYLYTQLYLASLIQIVDLDSIHFIYRILKEI